MLLPKPVRRLLTLLIVLLVGFQSYQVVKVHTRQEVLAFKRFAEAVKDGDLYTAGTLAAEDRTLGAVRSRGKRTNGIPGQVRLSWYSIQDVRLLGDGKNAVVTARQVIRYDPVGANTLWGAESMYNTIRGILVQQGSSWKIREYQDSFFVPGLDDAVTR